MGRRYQLRHEGREIEVNGSGFVVAGRHRSDRSEQRDDLHADARVARDGRANRVGDRCDMCGDGRWLAVVLGRERSRAARAGLDRRSDLGARANTSRLQVVMSVRAADP